MDKPTVTYSKTEGDEKSPSKHFSQQTVILQEQFGKPNTYFLQH